MSLYWVLQRLSASVFILAIGTAYCSLLIKWSLWLTSRLSGTPIPRAGPSRIVGMAFCVALMHQLLALAQGTSGTGFTGSGVIIGHFTVPFRWIIGLPFEFFLVAGLMIRFLPTTFRRGCLIALNYQLFSIAALIGVIACVLLARYIN